MKNLAFAALAAFVGMASAVQATPYVVQAAANSSTGGTGLSTIALTSGQILSVSVAANDLWNAGSLPRWSNADGLVVSLFATGSDDSGQAAGTLIGFNFPFWTQNGHSSAYGSLVGRIGGIYQTLGSNFVGPAWNTGVLELFYWDENSFDNTQFITANISARPFSGGVPEPASWAMMISGLALVGAAARRRRGMTVSA